MEIRAALLPNMTDVEKSVKQLVTEANLRLVGLLAPHQDVRESTAGSATDMASENMFDMYNAPEAPTSKKKTSRRHHGESIKAPPAKNTRTPDPSAEGPSKNATPTPSPLGQQTPLAPVGSAPSPPTPFDQTQQASPASTGGDISS
ncbi:uncharacterized protein LOC133803316 [Humulus lupulus]|uniref:uncharacterized protein LOC133803316 n=1 Tax=Humulus lupulus TaxID=3486 RepID=UPI002B4032C0|nr:uncharacterized protein LOC133803316 [Humulus lupulus]